MGCIWGVPHIEVYPKAGVGRAGEKERRIHDVGFPESGDIGAAKSRLYVAYYHVLEFGDCVACPHISDLGHFMRKLS
jgi:hypothetical protein